ncbi:MAG TPA: amidohydrolase family protein [Chryseosolibacter sp.]
MKKLTSYISLVVVFITTGLYAQVPVPVKPQGNPIALTGATVHLGNGRLITNAVVGFDKGKITLVAEAASNPNLTGYEVLNVNGKHVYPGFILPDSPLGLVDVSSVRAMNDVTERGELNPNVRAQVAYNTDSEMITTMRLSGILLAQATPSGGRISGTSSFMELEGWDWEDATHTADIAVHLYWPSLMTNQFDFTTFTSTEVPNKEYDKEVSTLNQFFTEAVGYGKLGTKEVNLKMEAMQGLFDGKKALMIYATKPKEIVSAVTFAKKYGAKRVVLVSGSGTHLVAEFLKENSIPVVLQQTHNLPERPDDDIDLPYKLPHLLTQAGISVSLSHDGMPARARNLAFYAGTAAAYGMDKEEALKMICFNPAKALGVDNRVGTIDVGKDATLFVSEGDVMDMKSCIVSHAFISGKLVNLPTKQEELYERYSKKYGHE